jgi:hypothetical protein
LGGIKDAPPINLVGRFFNAIFNAKRGKRTDMGVLLFFTPCIIFASFFFDAQR